MFVYQDGKLYTQTSDGLVGVNVSSDNVSIVKGTNEKYRDGLVLTGYEVKCKFDICEENAYVFPRDKKVDEEDGVVNDRPTKPTKSTARKSTGK